jgi:hypothetical protein
MNYDINNEENINAFGVVQGRMLVTDPDNQGVGMQLYDGCDDFTVGVPDDILADDNLLHCYCNGVQTGINEMEHDWSGPSGARKAS